MLTPVVGIRLMRASAISGAPPQPSDFNVAAIALGHGDSDVVYVAVGDDYDPEDMSLEVDRNGRILRSDDGGATWTTTDQRWFIAANQRFRSGPDRLAVDPNNPDHVVFGSQREGLWQSMNGGATWEPVPFSDVPAGLSSNGLGPQAGVSFATFVSIGGRSVLFAGAAHDGLYRSDDGGATWTQIMSVDEGVVPAAPAVAGDSLLVALNTLDQPAARLVRIDLATSNIVDVSGPDRQHVLVRRRRPRMTKATSCLPRTTFATAISGRLVTGE